MRNPFRIRGYEKFWAALLAGNSVQVPIIITLIGIASMTSIPEYMPTTEIIIGAVGIFWGALSAALGTFLATTSAPTEADPHRSQVGIPMPSADASAAAAEAAPPKKETKANA